METTVKQRIKEFIKHKDMSVRAFERSCGLSNGYINSIEQTIMPNKVKIISLQYPDLNIAWLLTGEGEMLKPKHNDARMVDDFQFMQVPFVNVPAQGGYPKGYGDEEYIDSLPTIPVIVDKSYKGKYRVFEVSGDSMDDGGRYALYDGDKILCREVKRELWNSKLHMKDWFFVLVCRTEGVTVKQIIDHNTETGDVTCHPLNPIFDDFVINLDDVVELYNVIKIVDRNTRM